MSRRTDHHRPTRGWWLAGVLAVFCFGVQAFGPVLAILGAAGWDGHSVEVRNLDGCIEVHLVHPALCGFDVGDCRGGKIVARPPVEPDHVLVFGSVGFGEELLNDDDLPILAEGLESARVGPMERMAASMPFSGVPAWAGPPTRWRGEVMRV